MLLDVKAVEINGSFWNEINKLAKEAFPPEEYLAPTKLVEMASKDEVSFLALSHNGSFVGFTVIKLYGSLAYLFFLAIAPARRSQGYGAAAIATLKSLYPDRKHVVDFEMIDENAPNLQQRIKRKAFYLKNGYRETGLFLPYLGVDYEVTCMEEELDAEEFKEMLYHISIEGFEPQFFRGGKQYTGD